MTSHLADWLSVSDSTHNRLRHKCGSIPHGSVWSTLFFPPRSLSSSSLSLCSSNSWSHSYASWISNAYLWSGLMHTACPDSVTDSTTTTLSPLLLSLPQSSTLIIPPSWQHSRYLLNHTECWHGYNSLLTSRHCSPLIHSPTFLSSIPAEYSIHKS